MKDKKGMLGELFVFMASAFVLGVVCVIMFYVVGETNTKLHEQAPVIQKMLGNASESDSYNATHIIQSTYGKVPTAYEALKWITAMLIIGMALNVLIMAFLTQMNPVWFGAYVFITVIAIIVSVPLSNAYETVYATPILAASFSGFVGQNWIFLNLPIWITVIGMIAGIIMFINMIRVSRTGGYV